MDKQPWETYDAGQLQTPEFESYPVGRKDGIFGGVLLLLSFLLWNCLLFAGANLGFAVAAVGCILCSALYLHCSGHRVSGYSGGLLLLSLSITAGFARSDDSFVKFVCVCFLLVSTNLALCLMAGQNRRDAGSVRSLLDAPRAVLRLGVGDSPQVFRGLKAAFRRSGDVGKKGSAFLLGLVIALPVIALMLPLLIRADAAFDGLMALLPEFEFSEFFATVLFGTACGCVLFVRGVALHRAPKAPAATRRLRGISEITVNTVLGAVALLYGVYLLSQLAYFSGGFAGILPEEYTLAEYARRGFFEMAMLSGGNLLVMVLGLGLVSKEKKAPIATRLLCLFVGIVTLFLIATASAKMFLYIGSYGLTRLRVLTQIIMLFLAVTTLTVSVWLFVPKLQYMKVVLLVALLLGSAVLWTDVDTQVANYNVNAYLSGQLENVDVSYLYRLGNGAVPALARLAEESPNDRVALAAKNYMQQKLAQMPEGDIRDWNYVNHKAVSYGDKANPSPTN